MGKVTFDTSSLISMMNVLNMLTSESLALLSRHDLLRRLVEEEVIAEAVGKEPLNPAQCQQALTNFFQAHNISNDQELNMFMKNQGLTWEDIRWQSELPLRIRTYSKSHFRHKSEARFLERKNQLDHAIYTILRTKDRNLARELYFRVAEGEADLSELSGTYSEGAERATKGIVGPVPLTQAHPALAERLRTSAPGKLLEPFPVAEWWLVMRLERYIPASFNEQIAEQMCAELFHQWVQEETTRRLEARADSKRVAGTVDKDSNPVVKTARTDPGEKNEL